MDRLTLVPLEHQPWAPVFSIPGTGPDAFPRPEHAFVEPAPEVDRHTGTKAAIIGKKCGRPLGSTKDPSIEERKILRMHKEQKKKDLYAISEEMGKDVWPHGRVKNVIDADKKRQAAERTKK